jgi:hypothetical protein
MFLDGGSDLKRYLYAQLAEWSDMSACASLGAEGKALVPLGQSDTEQNITSLVELSKLQLKAATTTNASIRGLKTQVETLLAVSEGHKTSIEAHDTSINKLQEEIATLKNSSEG